MTREEKKALDKMRMRQERTPDKNCIRCDHAEKKALRVVGKTERGEKVVLCLNCREELKG